MKVWLLKWYTCSAILSCKQSDFLQWQVDNLHQLLVIPQLNRPRGISRLWEYANQILKKRKWWVSYEKLHYLYNLLLVFCLLSLSQQKKRMCQHFWDLINRVFLCNISVYCLYIHAYRFNFYLYYLFLIFFFNFFWS